MYLRMQRGKSKLMDDICRLESRFEATMIYLKSFDYSNLHEANRKVISEGEKAA